MREYCTVHLFSVMTKLQHESVCTANPELMQSLTRIAESAKAKEVRRNEFFASSTAASTSWDPSVRCGVCAKIRVFSNEADYLVHMHSHSLFCKYCGLPYARTSARKHHENKCPRNTGK